MNQIPADSTPNQQMTIRYGDDVLQLTVIWNSVGTHWYMDIFDVAEDAYVAQYVPLEVGTPIGRRLGREWVFMLADLSAEGFDPVSADELGTRCVLLIGTLAEVIAELDAEAAGSFAAAVNRAVL
jgi:hypothetical protein